jgi:hypothetical protein
MPMRHPCLAAGAGGETGGNVFMGKSGSSFFGQFEYATNIYGTVRYSI